MLYEKKVENNGVSIHFLDYNPQLVELTPLVIIPGLSEAAEDYIEVMEQIFWDKLNEFQFPILVMRGEKKGAVPLKQIGDVCKCVCK